MCTGKEDVFVGGVRVGQPERLQNPIVEPFNVWVAGPGAPDISFHKNRDHYLIRVENYADFSISSNGRCCNMRAVDHLDDETRDHLIRTIVQPFALGLTGQIVLHASCIEIDGRAVAFLGESGTGKSTLATKFTTDNCKFVTDDCLHVEFLNERFVANPGDPSVRLWENSFSELLDPTSKIAPPVSYTGKSRALIENGRLLGNSACPLSAIFILEDLGAEVITIRALSGSKAHGACTRHTFLIDPYDTTQLTASFHRIVDLVSQVSCFTIDFPRDFDFLKDVQNAILSRLVALDVAA